MAGMVNETQIHPPLPTSWDDIMSVAVDSTRGFMGARKKSPVSYPLGVSVVSSQCSYYKDFFIVICATDGLPFHRKNSIAYRTFYEN